MNLFQFCRFCSAPITRGQWCGEAHLRAHAKALRVTPTELFRQVAGQWEGLRR